MKNIFIALIAILILHCSMLAQKDSTRKDPGANIQPFWPVVLKTGPMDKEIKDSTERSKLFAGHFSNMEKWYYEGILKAAGPFGKNDFTWRGLFILACKTKEEAEGFVKTDPTVAAGIFIYDLVPWFA